MALVTTLEKAEDVAVYAKHPEHVKVADTYVRPYTTERAAPRLRRVKNKYGL